MAKEFESQTHSVASGNGMFPPRMTIERNGNHQYRSVSADGTHTTWCPSVTAICGHLESGQFTAGKNWFKGLVTQHNGDIEQAEQASEYGLMEGNRVHAAIDNYIKHGVVDEDDDVFMQWYIALGDRNWIASEHFVIRDAKDSSWAYGGTVDAIERVGDTYVVWDWKTKDINQYKKYGSRPKEHAQLSGYFEAINHMGWVWDPIDERPLSPYRPNVARLAYIFRDASPIDIVDVDLSAAGRLFHNSRLTYYALKEFRNGRR